MEVNGFHREDFFLAQIAAEVCKGRVKNPRHVRLEQFLCKFKLAGQRSKPQSKKSRQQAVTDSKRHWLGALGLSMKGKGKK